MADTTRITVTLPSDQVAELRKLPGSVSGFVAEAVARRLRSQLLSDGPRCHQAITSAIQTPDTIRQWLEGLRSLGGGSSRDDVVAEVRKIRES